MKFCWVNCFWHQQLEFWLQHVRNNNHALCCGSWGKLCKRVMRTLAIKASWENFSWTSQQRNHMSSAGLDCSTSVGRSTPAGSFQCPSWIQTRNVRHSASLWANDNFVLLMSNAFILVMNSNTIIIAQNSVVLTLSRTFSHFLFDGVIS